MEEVSEIFKGDVPYVQIIEGTVDGGSKFRVEGRGIGNAQTGYQRGKWVCKTGKLPVPWALLAPTLQYGFLAFGKYPDGIQNFSVESFPEGHTYDRTLTFDNDGVVTTHHDLVWQKDHIMSKVTFSADGFSEDSPVLNNGIGLHERTVSTCFPTGKNGGKNIVNMAFPIKGGDKDYAHATMITNIKLAGTPRYVPYPDVHFYQTQQEQFKDQGDQSDHICQHEAISVFDFTLLHAFNMKL